MQRQHNSQRVLDAEDTRLLSSANNLASAYHTDPLDYLLSQIHDANRPFLQPTVQEDLCTPFYANPVPRANGYYYDAAQQYPNEAEPSSRTEPYTYTMSSAGNVDLSQNEFNTYIPNVPINNETRIDGSDETSVDYLIESTNLSNLSSDPNLRPGSDAVLPYDESIPTYQSMAEYEATEGRGSTASEQTFIPETYPSLHLSPTAPPRYTPHQPDPPARLQSHVRDYASPRSASSWQSNSRFTDPFAASGSSSPSTVTSFEASTSQAPLDRGTGAEGCWSTDYASSSTLFLPQNSWDWMEEAPPVMPHAPKRSREEDDEIAEHPAKRRRNAIPDLGEVDTAPDRKQKRKQLEYEDDDDGDERQLKKMKNDGHSVSTTAVPARRASPEALRHHKESVARSSSGVDTSATRARNNIDPCEVKGPERTPSGSGSETEQTSTQVVEEPAVEEPVIEEHRCKHPGCNRTFGRPQDVDRHMKTVASHRTTAEKEHACPETGCRTAYTRRDALLRHGQKYHGWPKSTRRTRRKT